MPERRFRQVDAFSTDEMQRDRALRAAGRGGLNRPGSSCTRDRSPGAAATPARAWPRPTPPAGLADLIRGVDSDLTRLPWVGHRSRVWEPEPFRWLAVHAVASIGHVTGWRDRRRSS